MRGVRSEHARSKINLQMDDRTKSLSEDSGQAKQKTTISTGQDIGKPSHLVALLFSGMGIQGLAFYIGPTFRYPRLKTPCSLHTTHAHFQSKQMDALPLDPHKQDPLTPFSPLILRDSFAAFFVTRARWFSLLPKKEKEENFERGQRENWDLVKKKYCWSKHLSLWSSNSRTNHPLLNSLFYYK